MNEVTIQYCAAGGYVIRFHCTYDSSFVSYTMYYDSDAITTETNLHILNWTRDGILPNGRKVEK